MMEIEAQPPQPILPNPPRLPSSCDRHPDEPVTGFCASCLRERLSGLENSASAPRNSTSSALKSIFLRPELRRCKSFSGSRGPRPPAAAFEPQRKSCDVRGRSTLWSLFHQDDRHRTALPRAEQEDAEIQPSEEIGGGEEEGRSMKEHIDLESQAKKASPKEIAGGGGSFWLKKLQNWRRKQKLKKQGGKAAAAPHDKTPKSSRRFRETQSEVAVDAFGRRSCDIDPRFSLDARRMSVDEPRFSWDPPRASWDGRSLVPRLPPMGEDSASHIPAAVERWDGRIPVEEDSAVPGGCAQTRDYYLDSSSSRRRRSLDRSSSVRKLSIDLGEPKPVVVSNARVSPAGATELFHIPNGVNRDFKDLGSNSLRDDLSESFESAFRDSQKGAPKKKSSRWSKAWNIWGLIKGGGRGGGGGGGGAAAGADNAVERSLSESWPELREQVYNGKIFRCNSTRNPLHNNAGFGSMRRSNAESNGHVKKRNGEFVMERNRSARYSPSHVDSGLLRFYLTPMRSSRRNGLSGKGRHSTSGSGSFAKTVMGMY